MLNAPCSPVRFSAENMVRSKFQDLELTIRVKKERLRAQNLFLFSINMLDAEVKTEAKHHQAR